MTKIRRSFTTDFKLEPAQLLTQQECSGITPKSKALTPEQQWIKELED